MQINAGLIDCLLNTRDVGCHCFHFHFGHTHNQVTHHLTGIVSARSLFESLQLGDDVVGILALQRRPSGRAVTFSAGRVATHAGSYPGLGNATAVDAFALGDQFTIERYRLGLWVS